MVWGIRFASEFNEFFPRGGFRGYDEALAAHYGAEPIPGYPPTYRFISERPVDGAGQPYRTFVDYTYHLSEKFHTEIGAARPHFPPLTPVQPHEWPMEYIYERIYKRPAAITVFTNRMYAVDEGLRDIIEQLEPGVHQFNPIRVLLPKGVEHPVKYHMMIVGRWLNSFSLVDSSPASLMRTDTIAPLVHPDDKKGYAGVAMRDSVIGDAHFWCEKNLRGPTFLISDALKAEVDKAGLRLPPHWQMKLIDKRVIH
jgi:hypothetical protein